MDFESQILAIFDDSLWTDISKLSPTDRNMQVRFCLKVVLKSWDWENYNHFLHCKNSDSLILILIDNIINVVHGGRDGTTYNQFVEQLLVQNEITGRPHCIYGIIDFDFRYYCHSSHNLRKLALIAYIPLDALDHERRIYKTGIDVIMKSLSAIRQVILVGVMLNVILSEKNEFMQFTSNMDCQLLCQMFLR